MSYGNIRGVEHIHESGVAMAVLHETQRAERIAQGLLTNEHLRKAESSRFNAYSAGSASGWLPQAHHINLSGRRGNGPFPHGATGVVLHVNASGRGSQGTSPQWYVNGGGPDSVCPTFQVMRDGSMTQFLPLNWEPWTQANGNSWGPSIETGGDPGEAMTQAQLASCGLIMAACHNHLGIPYSVTDSTGRAGLGTHGMGGGSWGGHTGCPGGPRSRQRSLILDLARGRRPQPVSPNDPNWSDMATQAQVEAACIAAIQKELPTIVDAVWNKPLPLTDKGKVVRNFSAHAYVADTWKRIVYPGGKNFHAADQVSTDGEAVTSASASAEEAFATAEAASAAAEAAAAVVASETQAAAAAEAIAGEGSVTE